MKKIILICLSILYTNYIANAQTDFKYFLDNIDWQITETEFVKRFNKNVTIAELQVWDSENTESNYSIKNVTIGGYEINKSYIRVKRDSRQLYRINLLVLYDETDVNKYLHLKTQLINQLGEPIKFESKFSWMQENVWVYDDYKISATFMDFSSKSAQQIEKYTYSISAEPIQTYYVNSNEAIAELNNANEIIPNIECFRVDNDSNIYIKEQGKSDIVKQKKKIYPTPKGKVVSFEDGMFCYRKENNDIVYIRQGLAVTYPVK